MRWVAVAFPQGEGADWPLRILGELGNVDAVDYLRQWGYGDEPPSGRAGERVRLRRAWRGYERPGGVLGRHALVVNPHVRYVSLLRRYTGPEAEQQGAEQVGPLSSAGWCRQR